MSTKNVVGTLNQLHRICKISERGFDAVSENVQNRGLKLLLRMYAEQRRRFAQQLKIEVERLGGQVSERRNLLGIIHRGRIDIMATLILEPDKAEMLALREARTGETLALKTYKNALEKALPEETKNMLRQQFQAVQAAYDEVQLLIGRRENRLVVHLLQTEQDVNQVSQKLAQAGINDNAIQMVPVDGNGRFYQGKRSTMDETIISGAVGGAIWVGIFAAISGAAMVMMPGLNTIGNFSAATSWALITLCGVLVGMLFGVILGMFIGMAVHEEDAHIVSSGIQEGNQLIKLNSNSEQAHQAHKIMRKLEASYTTAAN